MTISEEAFNKFSEKDRMNRTLEGVAYWCHVQKPKHSEKYKNDAYEVSLVLDAANVKRAESFGLQVYPAEQPTATRTQEKCIPGPFVKISRKVRPGKTFEETKPDVVDSMQEKVPNDVLIGNGSNIIVKFGTYYFGDWARTTLFKVQILKLVPFAAKDGGFKRDDTGYRASATGTSDAEGFDA